MQVLMSLSEWKKYPDCPKVFPNELLNEKHANSVHCQSLDKLDSRGGLHPCEIVINVNSISPEVYIGGDTTLWDTGIAIRRITNYINNYL